jgi:tRNA pseudouridine55 synthase
LQAKTKEYIATLQLGATTPSFDLETEVDATFPTAHITREKIEEALTRFIGRIEQVPPSYSACKVDGKRAYDLARQGKEVELKAKVLVIDEIELQNFNPTTMQATIRVVCSKGTYIRALARDIGLSLNSGAHLTALRRTRIGDYKVEDCHTLETFQLWLETLLKETEK